MTERFVCPDCRQPMAAHLARTCRGTAMLALGLPRHRAEGPAQLFMFRPDYVARHRAKQ